MNTGRGKSTKIIFADGRELIVHHQKEFTHKEKASMEKLTSEEFKKYVLSLGKFVKIPMRDNPFLDKS